MLDVKIPKVKNDAQPVVRLDVPNASDLERVRFWVIGRFDDSGITRIIFMADIYVKYTTTSFDQN